MIPQSFGVFLGCCLVALALTTGTPATSAPVFSRVGALAVPEGPVRLIALAEGWTAVVVTGQSGVILCTNGRRERVIARGDIADAIAGDDGALWYLRRGRWYATTPSGTRIWRSTPFARVATVFRQAGRIYLDRLGYVWGEHCAQRMDRQGQCFPAADLPEHPGTFPAPVLTDQYGNQWTLVPREGGTAHTVALLTPTATAWSVFRETEGLPAGQWQWIVNDRTGFIWVAGMAGVARYDPRKPKLGWFLFPQTDAYPAGPVSALAVGPDGRALVAVAGGLFTLDRYADGTVMAQPVYRLATPVRALHTDTQGAIWTVAGDALFRCAASPDAWQATWEALAPMPYAAHDVYGIVSKHILYIPGGAAYHGCPAVSTNFDRLLMYDIRHNRWDASPPMSSAKCYSGVAEMDGHIWVIGGSPDPAGKRRAVDEVEIYDPRTRQWRQGPSLDTKRMESIVAVARGRLYVIGGAGDTHAYPSMVSIAPGEKSWRSEPSAPYPINQCDGCVLNGVMYIMLGGKGLLAYDPATRQWRADLPPIPTNKPPRAAQVAAFKGEVWVLGGTDTPAVTATWRYSPVTNTWQPGPDLPAGRSWGDALEMDGHLLIFGGAYKSAPHGDYTFIDTLYRLR